MRTTKEFIKLSNEKHSNKFSYANTSYINSGTKVTITCPVHGDFEQVANSHLLGSGCKKCADQGRKALQLEKHRAAFIAKASAKLPELDYSLVEWDTSTTPITVVCKAHGPFVIGPNALLHKNFSGCALCIKEQKRIAKATSFISMSTAVHGNLYDYSKVLASFTTVSKSVPIICPQHGEFFQTPKNHLKGSICHSCSRETRGFGTRYNRIGTPAILYFVFFKEYDVYKLGVTIDIVKRFNGEPHKPIVLFTRSYEHEAQAYLVETLLFRGLYKFKYRGDPVLHRKGNSELLTKNVTSELLPSVETIESTEEFKALTGSE